MDGRESDAATGCCVGATPSTARSEGTGAAGAYPGCAFFGSPFFAQAKKGDSARQGRKLLREARASGRMTRRVRKGDRDAQAARVILQQWLESRG